MKVTLRFTGLILGLILWNLNAWAQPANDQCSGAQELTIYNSEAEAVPVAGDTRNTEDGSIDGIPVCSGNFYRDDVWYVFTTPSVVSESGYAIKVYFNQLPDDINAMGIAVYNSCDATTANQPIFCGNNPGDDLAALCLNADQTYYVRVWSAEGDATAWETGWGTFRIAIFPRPVAPSQPFNVLWGDQPGQGQFEFGLDAWTTEGIQCNGTDPSNALWTWTSTGLGAYIFGDGAGISPIKSKSFCNGAAIFDSGYLDYGDAGTSGSGPCPWNPHEGALISPVIDISSANVFGVSLLFNQSMQRFWAGEQYVTYSLDGGTTWADDILLNSDYTYLSVNPSTGTGYYNEEIRIRLPGAENSNNLRIRFRFSGYAYWWVIDDVRIVETEANNLISQSNFYAIPPWAMVPTDQVYPYWAENDILNAGAAPQNNVVLNHTIKNDATKEVIYNENLNYGTIAPDFLAENIIFPESVDVPSTMADYTGVYSVDQDEEDFDLTNNSNTFHFSVGGSVLAHEDASTRAVAVATGVYDDGAPYSYGYGNVFKIINDVEVDRVQWGIANAVDLIDLTVNIYIIKWTDNNGDQIAQPGERRFVAYGDYTFTGTEGENVILESVLDNFDVAGDPIILKGGDTYFVMIEYAASDNTFPQLFLLASEARNFNATTLASDSAFVHGLSDYRIYMTVLQFSPDGIIANIDFEVRELDPTDARIHFSDDIVPVIRIVTKGTNTNTPLPLANQVSIYPNPATDDVQVKLEFTKPYQDVKLRLIDNLGRTVYTKEINQSITAHIEKINVSQLTAGNYMLQVETVDGQRSIPVVVIK